MVRIATACVLACIGLAMIGQGLYIHAKALLAQVLLEFGQCEIHRRVEITSDDRRDGADILALAARHLVRQQHRDGTKLVRRILLQKDLLHPQFVRRVLDRVRETDNDRLGARVDECPQGRAHIILVEFEDH